MKYAEKVRLSQALTWVDSLVLFGICLCAFYIMDFLQLEKEYNMVVSELSDNQP